MIKKEKIITFLSFKMKITHNITMMNQLRKKIIQTSLVINVMMLKMLISRMNTNVIIMKPQIMVLRITMKSYIVQFIMLANNVD